MNTSFYRAFEDRYRGSREMIKARQSVYLPFIEPFHQFTEDFAALDLGCGRGEWLELLLENGYKSRGIDLDEGMLDACKQLKLPAEQGDAIAALFDLPDDSQSVISAFHLVEHIPFEALQQLVSQALRVLKPAGLLILETPNPENLIVAGSSFYLDPTHERPLPQQLLSFLTEFAGFSRNKILGLQEAQWLKAAQDVDLLSVLGGVSPDYAVIAQKQAPAEQMALFDSVFDKEYGLTLDVLSSKYEAGVQRKFAQVQGEIDQVLRETLNVQLQRAEERGLRYEQQRDAAQLERNAVLNSMSWRITAPIRKAVIFSRSLKGRSARVAKTSLRSVLWRVRHRLLALARRNRWLHVRLRRFRYYDHRLRNWLGIGGPAPMAGPAAHSVSPVDNGPISAHRFKKGHNEEQKSPLESWFNR